MSSDLPTLALMLVLGFLLGLAFFLGLWATLRHLPRARHPALLTLASLLVRLALLLAALALLTGMQADRLLAALAGIILARLLLHRRIGVARGQTP